MTRVGHVKRDKGIYVGRPSKHGNPYRIGRDGTRRDVIRKFTEGFMDKVDRDPAYREEVMFMKDETLLCWCRPKKGFRGQVMCHAQVIAGYIDGVNPRAIE